VNRRIFAAMARPRISAVLLASSFLALVACSGGAKSARNPDDATTSDGTTLGSDDNGVSDAKTKTASLEERGWADVEQKDATDEQKGSRKKDTTTTSSNSVKDNPDPEFKEGGSVDEAIKAVPQGLPRENLEQEALDKPLLNVDLYDPCKLTPSSHFEIRFAVWDGRCVGVDVKTTPKNPKLEACLRDVVSQVKWRERTKSLNISTVTF
jgi:hypothetical protein